MKNAIQIFMMLVVLAVATGCKSTKIYGETNFSENPPFKIIEAFYTVTETDEYEVNIVVDNNNVIFEFLFFKEFQGRTNIKEGDSKKYRITAKLNNNRHLDDIKLHADPKEEFGNKLPLLNKENKLFKLRNNDAVLSYYIDEVRHFMKIEKLQRQ